MLEVGNDQRGLMEADHLYLDHVGRDSFYGFLATLRDQLFREEEFARLYCPNNGRNSVPPSVLATALLPQAHDKVSDEEAKLRADFDVRWRVALGIAVEVRPFAKSTLQLFRAQLIIHDEGRAVFQRSLGYARETGYLKPIQQLKRSLSSRPSTSSGRTVFSPFVVSLSNHGGLLDRLFKGPQDEGGPRYHLCPGPESGEGHL